MTILGTRPEIIRLSLLINKLDQTCEHILVNTGQNYDPNLSDIFFDGMNVRKPDYNLSVDTSSLGSALAEIFQKVETLLVKYQPDGVVILGDTNSAFAAVLAERMSIPVYHLEAGNRAFDKNVPEDLNRRMVDHVSSVNIAYTERAFGNLLREGLQPRFVYKSGSPMPEVFSHYQSAFKSSRILESLKLSTGGYFLASIHRQETVDHIETLMTVLKELNEVGEKFGMNVIFSTHPRTKSRIGVMETSQFPRLILCNPFSFVDYVTLQKNARCVISDSGTAFEEAVLTRVPTVIARSSSERLEALSAGNTILSGVAQGQISRSVNMVLNRETSHYTPDADYLESHFSDKVLSIILSTISNVKGWYGLR